MIPTPLIRFALLLLLPFCAMPARAETGGGGAPKMVVMGDSLACPRTPAGEIAVCGDKISAASLLNLQAYAACLVLHHRTEAELAARAYAARRERDPLRALVAADRSCTPRGGARMSAILLASALAEHLPGWRGRLHAGFAKVDQPVDMIQCAIAANPRLAIAVLRSAPLSADELAAVRRLVPALPACLPTGVQLETNRAALRAMFALALLDPAVPDDVRVDLASGPPAPVSGLAAPLLVSIPRIAVTPLAKVGAPPGRSTTNETLPSWTRTEDFGLHHGGYGHPDLPPQLLPEDELATFSVLPDANGRPPSPPESSLPGGSTGPRSPQQP